MKMLLPLFIAEISDILVFLIINATIGFNLSIVCLYFAYCIIVGKIADLLMETK